MSATGLVTKVIAGLALATFIAFGCSWDYPVWPKNKKSDTPLFRFNNQDGTGYIDRDGKVVIAPRLLQSLNNEDDDFFDGLAKVRVGIDQEWYIDRTGKPVFRSHFGGHFSEGLATSVQGASVGFIDRKGELVIAPSFESAQGFSEGLAAVRIKKRYGYIDTKGTVVVQPKYTLAEPYSDAAARVIEEGQCLYIGYGPCATFSPMTLPYEPFTKPSLTMPRCRYSFIDRQGIRLFESRYPDAKDFAEGLAPVGDGTLWGFVDRRGVMVISMRYEDAEPFAEGLAKVRSGGRWGYIDRTGRMIIPAVHQTAMDFSEGVAVVGDGSLRWFIDKTGRQAIPQRYSAASSFVMGRAHIRNGMNDSRSEWSYIDHDGNALFTYSLH